MQPRTTRGIQCRVGGVRLRRRGSGRRRCKRLVPESSGGCVRGTRSRFRAQPVGRRPLPSPCPPGLPKLSLTRPGLGPRVLRPACRFSTSGRSQPRPRPANPGPAPVPCPRPAYPRPRPRPAHPGPTRPTQAPPQKAHRSSPGPAPQLLRPRPRACACAVAAGAVGSPARTAGSAGRRYLFSPAARTRLSPAAGVGPPGQGWRRRPSPGRVPGSAVARRARAARPPAPS